MNRLHALKLLTLTSLMTLSLGTVACSKDSSPTEPGFSDLDQPAIAGSAGSAASATGDEGIGSTADLGSGGSLSSVTDESRGRGRGGDDNSGRGNGGRGGDDDDDDRGRRGRGGDDDGGDNRGGRGRGGRDDDNRPNNNPNNNNPNNPRAPRVGQEFEGAVASVGQGGVTLTNGTRIIVTGQTQWIARGDLHSLDQVARAVAAGRPTRVEGRGNRQGNGVFVALTIKAETDD